VVDGQTGVYWNETSEGTVYEIGYPGPDGKTKWKTIGGDLNEAIAARKELVSNGKDAA
jgi:hypothetical protein